MIRIIRKADDPKADLMTHFELTEVQAEDILEIRLRQLARLEGIKIEDELKALKAERKELTRILAEPKALTKLVVAEIEADAKRFGDARRTLIEAVAPVVVEPRRARRADHDHALAPRLDALAPGPRARRDAVRVQGRRRSARRARDAHRASGRRARHRGPRVHDPRVRDPGRPRRRRAGDDADRAARGAKVAQAISGVPEQKYLVAGSGGYGFIASLQDMVSRVKAGKTFMTLDAGRGAAGAGGARRPASITWRRCRRRDRLLVFALDEMREVPRGRGVIIMGLDGEERLDCGRADDGEPRRAAGDESRWARSVVQVIEGEELAKHRLRRARKGSLVTKRIKVLGLRARRQFP